MNSSNATTGRRCRCRPIRYLNNVVEQDHRAIKRRVRASQGFRSFHSAWRTIQGMETVNMIRKDRSGGCQRMTSLGRPPSLRISSMLRSRHENRRSRFTCALGSNFATLPFAFSTFEFLDRTGFPIRDIYLHSGETAAVADLPESAVRDASHAVRGIEGWFTSLSRNDVDGEAQSDYEDAFKSGNTILAPDTTEEERERAADVLNQHSPLNVHAEAGPACVVGHQALFRSRNMIVADHCVETIAGTSVGTKGSLGIRPSRRSSTALRRRNPPRFRP